MLRSVFGKCQTVFRQTVIGSRKICRYSPKVLPRVIIGIPTGVASYYSLKKFKTFNLDEFVEKHLVVPKLFSQQTLDYHEPESEQQRLFQYLSDTLADKLFYFLLDRIFDIKELDENEILLPLFQWQYAWQMIKAVAVRVEQTSPAVVRIFCHDDDGPGVGTGFFVDKEGLILTNSHVVQINKNRRVTVITADDKLYHGDVLRYDTKLDLAAIQIQGTTKEFTTIKLGDSDEVREEDSVIAIGSPHRIKLGVMSGTAFWTSSDHQSLVIKTHIPSYLGASGSPIINQNGEAIGVMHSVVNCYWYNNWTGKLRGPPSYYVYATWSNEAKKFLTEIKNQEKSKYAEHEQ